MAKYAYNLQLKQNRYSHFQIFCIEKPSQNMLYAEYKFNFNIRFCSN